MKRKSFDQWKIENSMFNKRMTFFVECDCGQYATKIYLKPIFECPDCKKKYSQKRGEYVLLDN